METKTSQVSQILFSIKLGLTSLILLLLETVLVHPAYSQTAESSQTSNIGDSSTSNQIMQSNPQIPITSSNFNTLRFPNIFPLDSLTNAFVNTENDLKFNLSAAVNTLDASNVTVYLGPIYQPGRTDDHNARMDRLRKETELLEVNKKVMEANLALLQKQIQEATIRLQNLQRSPVTP